MKLTPSDPDLATVYGRILSKELDLQPDFQRNEVWSEHKKTRLIDSILREWHVPPIHVVVDSDNREQVLDGKQRLSAIRDFIEGKLRVDGEIEPADPEIRQLGGLLYGELPPRIRRRFERFTIRLYSLTDYKPGEPAELFYRLNQPVVLTSAEQRNAYFGRTRDQVRALVKHAGSVGISAETIGFSNGRMAYDDVIARLCLALEHRSLDKRITASEIARTYRLGSGFEPETLQKSENAISMLAAVANAISGNRLRLNKATIHSWLWFFSEVQALSPDWKASVRPISTFVHTFEFGRHWVRRTDRTDEFDLGFQNPNRMARVFAVFNDRASSRVADVSSVVLRDMMIWIGAANHKRMPEIVARLRRERLETIEIISRQLEAAENPLELADSIMVSPNALFWNQPK